MNELGKPGIGLLPLMLEMYREYEPEMVQKQKPFIDTVRKKLEKFARLSVGEVCANRKEVAAAVQSFEKDSVDLIVIIFIAYATSISALNPLLGTAIPLLLFSTAPKSSMAQGMSMEDIMLNHGVHGYMDLANVFRRRGRQFVFVSGSLKDERAFGEIERWSKAARAKKLLGSGVIGMAGYTFDGMGDFGVDTTHLNATLGPELKHVPLTLLAESIQSIGDEELKREAELDRKNFSINGDVDEEMLKESNRFFLGLRKVVESLSLNAFTMHFQGILENPHIRTLPFLAISKLQQLGLAYAGEGDLLGATANLIMRYLCGQALFTETFCPDFDGGRIVMAHMGESNPAFGTKTVLRRKRFAFGEALDPVIADVHMREGKVTVLNLGIVDENYFQMIVYTGRVCKKIPGSDAIDMPYFHFKPDMPLEELLTEYGLLGGTHHLAMTEGDRREELVGLAQILNVEIVALM
jgi:L-arabinose isomerase